jgi:hypothetical protein
MGLAPVLIWLESTRIASAIAQSSTLTGVLSAVHVIGVTLVGGSAFVAGLRLLGAMFPSEPINEVTGAAARGITVGLAIAVATGLLLFSARATVAAANEYFQIKMLLLAAAAGFHFSAYRSVTRRSDAGRAIVRFTGAAGIALWFGVVAAGAAFILLE